MEFEYEHKNFLLKFYRSSPVRFCAHFHHHVEMFYVIKGCCNVTVDGVRYKAEQGDVGIIFPNQIHEYNENSREDSFYMSIFDPSGLPEHEQVFENYVPQLPIIKGIGDNQRMTNYLDIMDDLRKTPYYPNAAMAILSAFMFELFPQMNLVKCGVQVNDTSHAIIDYCSRNFRQQISLSTISKELFISRHYVSEIFQKRIKMNYLEYIHDLRISEAKRLLKTTDIPVIEIAANVGFSQRTFNRVFLELVGMTPSDYRDVKRKSQ